MFHNLKLLTVQVCKESGMCTNFTREQLRRKAKQMADKRKFDKGQKKYIKKAKGETNDDEREPKADPAPGLDEL